MSARPGMNEGPIKVLLAEGDPNDRESLTRSLQASHENIQVTPVGRGHELLQRLSGEYFDCIATNFDLSDYCADELIQEASPFLVGCPVVVFSQNQQQEIVVASFRAGAADFLPKSIAMAGDDLWRSVEQAVNEARSMLSERRQQERREEHLVKLCETDSLTGLHNRHYFERCVKGGRWDFDRRKMMTCLMIDIDHFKKVNDTFGHNAGDEVIRSVAGTIKSHTHGSDITIRWGGEEMLVLRPSHSLVESWQWAESLRADIESSQHSLEHPELKITISIGLVRVLADQVNEDAVEKADVALYLAKQTGRNRICTFEMSKIEDTLKGLQPNRIKTFDLQLIRFLRSAKPHLGPTQLEHIREHGEHVSAMAMKIARVMQLETQAYHLTREAALIHDIGKCMVPEEILSKPASLSLPERSIISKHAGYGSYICERLGLEGELATVVASHHERFDAHSQSKQPERVRRVSRIINASDALVTMMSDRPYKDSFSFSEALAELRRERERQFCPDVVDAAHFVSNNLRLAA